MCKVSIIIPVYNAEKYLEKCLNSVIKQTLKDIEIICINDGSTDGSLNILQKYSEKDKRFIIIDQKNSGQSVARNKGLSVAKGEFIGFVDSDDWIGEDFYEKLYDAAIEHKADIAAGNILRVHDNEENEFYIKYDEIKIAKKTNKKYKLTEIPEHCYIWNKIYNRKKLEKVDLKFKEGILYEDIIFTHKVLFYMKDLVTVPNSTYYYYDNPLSTVNVDSEKRLTDRNRAFIEALQFVQDNCIKYEKYYRKYKWDKKITYSILGIPILIIRKYCSYKYFYLFGFINVFSVKVNTRNEF